MGWDVLGSPVTADKILEVIKHLILLCHDEIGLDAA